MPAHKDLTGVDLHEPKGISTAAAGDVYVADGSGSGTWQEFVIPEGTFTMQHKLYTSGITTWNKPANLMFIRVFIQGGGRGGDGAGVATGTGGTSSFGSLVTATGGNAALQSTGDINSAFFGYLVGAYQNCATEITSPASGDSGNWAVKIISASSLASTETVTVGAGANEVDDGNNGVVFVEEYIQV